MKNRPLSAVRRLSTAALLMAAAVLLPQLFHLVGGPAAGSIFLPMHLPVFLAGIFIGPYYAAAVGLLSPLLSFLMTGMPPAALLPFMMVELTCYGLISGFLSRKGFHTLLCLISAQIGGRLVEAAVLFAAAALFHVNVSPAAMVFAATVTGLPGIAIQLVLIPAAVVLLRKVDHFDRANPTG